MNSHPQTKDMSVIEQAAFWATCLEDGSISFAERKKLAHWLRKSPEHLKELLLAQALLTDAEGIDPLKKMDVDALLADVDTNIVRLDNRNAAAHHTGKAKIGGRAESTLSGKLTTVRNAPRIFATMAAGLVLAAITLVALNTPFGQADDFYGTATGEQRSVSLADGSVVHLNTQTELRVSYHEGERNLYLLKGEALFDVAHDPNRPFRVHIGTTVAQALGTSFNIYNQGDKTDVTVLEGTVAVSRLDKAPSDNTGIDQANSSPASPVVTTLTVGQEASVPVSGAITTREIADVQKIVYWRQRKLIFEDTPVSDIVREFNRYNTTQIIVENVGFAEPRFSGVFEVDKPNAFIKTLEASGAVVQRLTSQRKIIVNLSTYRNAGASIGNT